MKYGFNISYDKQLPTQTLKYQTTDFKTELREVMEKAIKGNDVSIIYKHAEIIRNWFPKGGYHIFISHSHKDVDVAKYIANKLYSHYGIKSFIDSEFWVYVDEIISEINHKNFPCGENNEYLSYEPCMRVASNFYLILADALLDAINLSDSCWFLNTSNSIHCTESLKNATYSPWIYSELKYTSVIERRWHEDRPLVSTESLVNAANDRFNKISESANVSVEYIAPLEHLTPVSENVMNKILNKGINDIELPNATCKHAHFYWLNSIYDEMFK